MQRVERFILFHSSIPACSLFKTARRHNLSFEKHLALTSASCSKRAYLLKRLRDGGMPVGSLRFSVR